MSFGCVTMLAMISQWPEAVSKKFFDLPDQEKLKHTSRPAL